jgi:nitrile hydratase beta subunit
VNGIHDMGGMQDMGPVQREANEPVFHHPWEGRVFAIYRAAGAWRKWNIDAARFSREMIPPAEYLRMSYYEKWFAGLMDLLVSRGLVTRAEIESGKPAPGSAHASPTPSVDQVLAAEKKGASTSRDVPVAAHFRAGQSVRTRNMNPLGHTRLPRYARGKLGTIDRDFGVFVLPDTNAEFRGENPQHVYAVRFSARGLWGDAANPRDSVYLSIWDEYLEPA